MKDGFEELVAEIFRADGYWVQQAVRVELKPEDKRKLNNYSMPNPEIDLVAYKARTNELLAIECKSYFDSGGIHARDLITPGTKNAGRYKMFVDAALREMVLERLRDQLIARDAIAPPAAPRLGLVFAHATTRNSALLQTHFAANGWFCLGPDWLDARLKAMAARTYDSQIATAVAKLLLRRAVRTVPPTRLNEEVQDGGEA